MYFNNFERLKKKYLPDGSYSANFFTMATGRIIAQTIPILLTPFLTRLYSPAEFGLFAIFVAVTAILALLANGRYNLAIVLPKKEENVFNLFALSNVINFAFCSILFVLIIIFRNPLLSLLNLEESPLILYLMPLGTFVIGAFEPLHYMAVRRRYFKLLSGNMIFQFTLISVLKIAFAFLAIGSLGLVWGHLIGYLAGILLLTSLLVRKKTFVNFRMSVSKNNLFKLANTYKKFPMYSLPADTLNAFSQQMPNLLLNNFFGSAIVGHFSLTQRVLASPITLISSAISDVFRERASSDYRETLSCRKIFVLTFQKLFIFSILPFTLLFFFAPDIVPFVFGREWAPAGEYIRIMTLLFFLRFSIAPLTSVMYVTGKQMYKLIWEIVSFLTIALSFYLGYKYFDQNVAIAFYSFSLSGLYLVLFFLLYKFSEDSNLKKL
jgi:O-antigen/teichoic acid export membrane protein